ncbi:hypothetical protein MMC13_006432 [Lambiella insularis]|nr:hypothetical protein [Lambiella insularis]
MPSRSNPNTPSSLRRKGAAVLKTKRKHTQHVVAKSKSARTSATGGVGKVKGTSQVIKKENARRRRALIEGKKGKEKGERMDVDRKEGEGAKGQEKEGKGEGLMDVD